MRAQRSLDLGFSRAAGHSLSVYLGFNGCWVFVHHLHDVCSVHAVVVPTPPPLPPQTPLSCSQIAFCLVSGHLPSLQLLPLCLPVTCGGWTSPAMSGTSCHSKVAPQHAVDTAWCYTRGGRYFLAGFLILARKFGAAARAIAVADVAAGLCNACMCRGSTGAVQGQYRGSTGALQGELAGDTKSASAHTTWVACTRPQFSLRILRSS